MPARDRSEYTAVKNGESILGRDEAPAQHLLLSVKDGGLPRRDGPLRMSKANLDAPLGIRLERRLRSRMAMPDLDRRFQAPPWGVGSDPVGARYPEAGLVLLLLGSHHHGPGAGIDLQNVPGSWSGKAQPASLTDGEAV